MVTEKAESSAQFVDRFLARIALGVFLIALAYTASAGKNFIGADAAEYLQWIKLTFGILAIVAVLPMFVRFALWRACNAADCSAADGFIASTFSKSAERAFSAAFITMVLLETVSKNVLAHLPAAFFLQLTMVVSLLVLSVSFFLQTRDQDGDEPNDFSARDAQ